MTGAVKLNTVGGGSVVVQPASSIASDVTVNVPSKNCTLGIQGPAFSAYGTALQSVSNVTWTKINFNTKEFDTATCFDTTNYRFTPNVAGYYQINAIGYATGSTAGGVAIGLLKNGSIVRSVRITNNISGTDTGPCVSSILYANGTTDYFEVYMWNNNGPQNMGSSGAGQSFSGALVRAA